MFNECRDLFEHNITHTILRAVFLIQKLQVPTKFSFLYYTPDEIVIRGRRHPMEPSLRVHIVCDIPISKLPRFTFRVYGAKMVIIIVKVVFEAIEKVNEIGLHRFKGYVAPRIKAMYVNGRVA